MSIDEHATKAESNCGSQQCRGEHDARRGTSGGARQEDGSICHGRSPERKTHVHENHLLGSLYHELAQVAGNNEERFYIPGSSDPGANANANLTVDLGPSLSATSIRTRSNRRHRRNGAPIRRLSRRRSRLVPESPILFGDRLRRLPLLPLPCSEL
jgi:hypothetical protein